MITGEEMLEELMKLEPSRLDEDTQKLFYTIMKVIDERDKLQERNERLKKNIKTFIEQKDEAYKFADDYYKENVELRIQVSSRETVVNELQQRIDGAIELIEEIQNFPHTNINQHKDMKKLKEILKGENND